MLLAAAISLAGARRRTTFVFFFNLLVAQCLQRSAVAARELREFLLLLQQLELSLRLRLLSLFEVLQVDSLFLISIELGGDQLHKAIEEL